MSPESGLKATPERNCEICTAPFFEGNPQPMWIYDLETLVFLAVNDAAVAHYGYSREEFLGMTLRDIRPAEDIPALLDNIAHITKGLDQAGVWRHRLKDGRIIFVEIISHTLEHKGRRAEMVLAQDITQRLEAEQALHTAHDYAEQLLEVAGVTLLVLDPEGRVQRINPAGCMLLSLPEKDILGRDWFADFVPLRMRGALHALFVRMMSGDPKVLAFHDNPIQTGSGEERLVSWHNAPLRDAQGQINGVLSSGQDITERQQLAEALRCYERIVTTAPDHVSMLDRNYVYQIVNDTYLKVHGRPREEIVGHTVAELLGQAAFENLLKPKLDRCLAGETINFQAWLDFAGVGRRYMDVSYSPYLDNDGQVTGVVVGGRDLTDLKQAEESHRASEERLHIILESAADAIIAIDETSHVVFSNPAASQLLGYNTGELQGMPMTDLMPERFRAQHAAGFARYLRTGQRQLLWQNMSLTVLTSDENEIPVEVSFGEQCMGTKHLFIGVIRDVRERHQAEMALQASERKYRTLVENLPTKVFLKDRQSVYVSCNELFAKMVGLSAADIVGHTDHDFFPANLASKYCEDDQRIMASGLAEEIEEDYLERGEIRTAFTLKTPVHNEAGTVTGILGIFSDITERKRTEDRLRQAATVFESSAEGIVITNAERNIVAVNRTYCEITGYAETEVLGRNPRLLQSGRQDKNFYQTMWATIDSQGFWRGEIWNRRKNGEIYPELLTINAVRDAQDKLVNYIGLFSDLSQIKQSKAMLERLAHYDPLTNLPNRLLIRLRLEHALERAHRHGSRLAVLCLDLDRFKNINDSLGHPAGDRLLMEFAKRLSAHLQPDATLGRLGGDEFVILIEDLKHSEAAAIVAQNVLHTLEQPFQLGEPGEVFIAASIGISMFPEDASDATQLFRNADTALYQAKEHGRNTYRFYTEALTRAADQRLTLESQLRRALERGEFLLHYQPQVTVPDGRLIGVEALVRWQHPELGLVPPDQFIPLAEETGLIVPLGEWVLFTACTQLKAWLDQGMPPFTIAVNLSSRQFRQGSLARHVHAVLDATGLPPALLELEITESAIMEQGDQAIDTLDALKALGVKLSIDDFGTGYSSLAYLKRFAVDTLKIDQSFVRDLEQDRGDREIAATIIAMAHNLDIQALAEGVETEHQLAFLHQHGCNACQGYLFSRPLPADALERWLAERSRQT